jgi:hypothetical protein
MTGFHPTRRFNGVISNDALVGMKSGSRAPAERPLSFQLNDLRRDERKRARCAESGRSAYCILIRHVCSKAQLVHIYRPGRDAALRTPRAAALRLFFNNPSPPEAFNHDGQRSRREEFAPKCGKARDRPGRVVL